MFSTGQPAAQEVPVCVALVALESRGAGGAAPWARSGVAGGASQLRFVLCVGEQLERGWVVVEDDDCRLAVEGAALAEAVDGVTADAAVLDERLWPLLRTAMTAS